MTGDEAGRQFAYDAWNRLVAVKDSSGTTLETFGYDGLNRRVSETAGGATTDLYYSSDWQVLSEKVGSSYTKRYVWSPVYVDAMVLRDRDTDGNGTLDERLWVQQDANWNVTALVNGSGAVVERYMYDPYGAVTIYDASYGTRSGSSYGWLNFHQGLRWDGTFEYAAETENMLWTQADDLDLWGSIKAPGVKRESRMARDNSEDGVTWNVFRYLERHGLLGEFVNLAAGERIAKNPRCIYWSFCQTSRKPWPPLLDAATAFGERVGRRSEPDIIVDDDDLLTFVENKWLSGNSTKPTDPDDPKRYVTGGDGWFGRVFGPNAGFKAVAVDAKLYELMRLWLLGSYIADRTGKRFLLVNVVRGRKEADIETRFGAQVRSGPERQIRRVTWESLYTGLVQPRAGCPDADRVAHYLREKSIGYRRVKGGTTAKLVRALSLAV